ncbi:RICIN domain-containing protein [Scytonema sp. PCC 10023]|uniref:RICIN domain-containing protein n=1 Tax=Scytonema sp. PCC 10023 TaxID=1680591 RepID=UPI0039C5C2C9
MLALSLRSDGAPAGLDDDPKTKATGYQRSCGDPGGTEGQGTRIAKATGGKLVQGVSANTIVETIAAELAAQITARGNVSLVASGATAPFVQAIAPVGGHGPLSRDQDHEISFNVSWIGTVPATYEDQVFNGSLDVIADGEVVGGKTVKITVPLDEEIPMPRPDDVSGNWMLIHHVTGAYLIADLYSPTDNDGVHLWSQNPPVTTTGNKGHLWVLEKQTDGTYLIKTWEKQSDGSAKFYLEAPKPPTSDSGHTRLQPRSDNSLQSWVLVPVSNDPDTYAIQPKDFPDYALGTVNNDSRFVAMLLKPFVGINRTWGKPTFHHYWQVSKPPADAQ